METLTAKQFRDQCLQLMDDLPKDGVLITKQGLPVAKLVPATSVCSDIVGNIQDLVIDSEDDSFTTSFECIARS